MVVSTLEDLLKELPKKETLNDYDRRTFSEFYEAYYEPEAIFEYIPNATKNVGKEMTVSFWKNVHG